MLRGIGFLFFRVTENVFTDKASGSDSMVSDDGVSPKTPDERSSRLSLSTGTNERPADQTFQTEEWVRVSDFDVGTPTSTTAKSDFDAHDSIGDARGHDKLAEWETVSRENAGNFSSAEEVGEGDHLAAEDSPGSGLKQGQKVPHVDAVLSGSESEKEDDKSVSSRSVGGKNSRSSSSSSSGSVGSRSDASPKKSDDEERSSSIVVVPSYQEHEDDSQESSYVEVGSSGAREDDYHGSVANMSSPERKEGDSAIEPASSEEQEEDNYDLFSGVEDHASSAIEPASSEEAEEEKYRLFSDLSNMKDPHGLLSGSDAVDLSSLIWSQSGAEEHQTTGDMKTEDAQVPEVTETPEVNKSSHEGISSPTSEPCAQSLPEIHSPERDVEEGASGADEATHDIEPTTPEKTSEKSFAENPYTFVRSVSDEETLESAKASPLEGGESAPALSLSEAQEGEENVAKEVHDFSLTSAVPEPNQEELEQLLEIAHSKEIAALGKQEEKILAQDLGKGIVEPQPLVDILSATGPSKPMEGGDVKDLQPVAAEETPLLKGSSLVDLDLHDTTELKDRVADMLIHKSGEELPESQGGIQDEHQTAEASLVDDSVSADESAEKEQRVEGKGGSGSFPAVDPARSVEGEEVPTEDVKGALVPLSTLTDSEWPKSSAESTKDVEVTFESETVDRTGINAGSSEKHGQVIYERREVSVLSLHWMLLLLQCR